MISEEAAESALCMTCRHACGKGSWLLRGAGVSRPHSRRPCEFSHCLASADRNTLHHL